MIKKRKLIEVALPLEAINRESAREKSIRHGHPSTFHLWWARRPLASCRAVLFASLVDDPSSNPDEFPTQESQENERQRLFRIIEQLVRWDNTTNDGVLESAHNEIVRSCAGDLPAVLDPFCGGGSIPLEAQRLGLESYATDLNPVAVLITKALVEIPPRFSGRPPVHPADGQQRSEISWTGAQGLAEDVRYYARWMRDQAAVQIGDLYPTVELNAQRGGGEGTVVAWLWARTTTCPNPACGSQMPLLTSLALSKRKGREVWLRPVPDRPARAVRFCVEQGPTRSGGSVGRSGASCLVCGMSVPLEHIREFARHQGLGSQLLCTVLDGKKSRVYVNADAEQLAASAVDRPGGVPDTEIPLISGIFNTPIYGIDRHWKLFTNRQLTALTTFTRLVGEARHLAIEHGADEAYADALVTYLALSIGRLANRCSTQCFWDTGGEGVMQVFARQALPMVWAYAEANPFSDSSGNFMGQVDYLAEALSRVPARGLATVSQANAAVGFEGSGLVCTDPPYYNNIPYADLSDFFYIWLRQTLSFTYPELFSTILVPKSEELIADPTRQGGRLEAAQFFEAGLRHAFDNILARHDERFPLTIFYAFKQAEDTGDGTGRISTGWETMLQGLLDAGAAITGTWPMRTEQPGGLREVGRAALASSIVLVCRKRPADAPLATRKDFVAELRASLPDALRELQHGNIAPVDLAQASIGPGMAVFSRYSRVVEADGSQMKARVALGIINQALDEILSEQDGEFDADSRWAIAWFDECGMDAGPFGKAEILSKAKNTAVNGLVQARIVEQRGNNVRLLGRGELPPSWEPDADARLTVWEVTQHLILALENGGEARAAEMLRKMGGLGELARDLAYRLYSVCENKKWASEALAYNALVVAWPEIARLASGSVSSPSADARLF